MANMPVDTNYKLIFADPEKYAKEFSEGLVSLENLLMYCYQAKIRTIACCSGNNPESKYAYIYFACPDKQLPYFKGVIANLVLLKIADFNYEIRAMVNQPNCEGLRGVIFRCNKLLANQMFNSIYDSLKDHVLVVKRDIFDQFCAVLVFFSLNKINATNLNLIYDDYGEIDEKEYKYIIKFFEREAWLDGYKVSFNGQLNKLSSLNNATTIDDLRGIYEVDTDLSRFKQNVLNRILK